MSSKKFVHPGRFKASSGHHSGGNGGGPQGPPAQGNLVFWFSADNSVYKDAGTTLAVNNDTVQQWNNRAASNNMTQATAGARPTYKTNQVNGKPVVSFDGSNDFLATVSTFTQTAPNHFFFVWKLRTWVNNAYMFDTNDQLGVVCDWGGVSPAGRFIYQTGWGPGGVPADLKPGSFHIMEIRGPAAANLTVQVNGGSRDGGIGQLGTAFTNRTFYLASAGGAARFCQVDVAEVLFYNTLLTDAQGNLTRSYLNSKYAIY